MMAENVTFVDGEAHIVDGASNGRAAFAAVSAAATLPELLGPHGRM